MNESCMKRDFSEYSDEQLIKMLDMNADEIGKSINQEHLAVCLKRYNSILEEILKRYTVILADNYRIVLAKAEAERCAEELPGIAQIFAEYHKKHKK